MPLPIFQPLPLTRTRAPFSHPDWLFEIKWDGFRALLHSDKDGVRLISRNGNTFKSFPGLCEGLARDLKGRRCVLDGCYKGWVLHTRLPLFRLTKHGIHRTGRLVIWTIGQPKPSASLQAGGGCMRNLYLLIFSRSR